MSHDGLGLGLVAGGFEMVKIGASIKVSLSFGDAATLGVVTVLLGGLLGAGLGVPSGIGVSVVGRRLLAPARHAAGMTFTAFLLACWYLWPVARFKYAQGMPPAALAFLLTPLGVAGVVWFNAHYWLRRESFGERYRLGWTGWSAVVGLALALLSSGWLASRTFGSARALQTDPAVLLVTIDTLRRDHVSFFAEADGQTPVVQTPPLDRLAREGVAFTNAVTPLPETAPAHAALFTGRHPVRNGVLSNAHTLARSYQTLAEVLQGEGFATGAFVSSIAVDGRTGLDQGFQVYDDDLVPWVGGLSEVRLVQAATWVVMRVADPTDFPWLLERPAPQTLDRALDWITRNRDRPFFAWVHLFEPHSPYEPHGMPGFEDNGSPGHPSVDHRYILSHEAGFTYTDDLRAKLRRLYAEEVAYTDQELGRFLDGVDALNLDRPLIIVVVGDHGEMLGEHGIEFNHHGIWDQTVRVPLIVVPHKLSAKTRVVDKQVRMMDVPATVLDLLELDPMENSEGAELMGFAEGVRHQHYATLLMGRLGSSLTSGNLLGYRAALAGEEGNVKLIIDGDTGRTSLYDLTKDPGEEHDIAAEQPEAVGVLRDRVAKETEGHVRVAPEVDVGTQRALRALGYVE